MLTKNVLIDEALIQRAKQVSEVVGFSVQNLKRFGFVGFEKMWQKTETMEFLISEGVDFETIDKKCAIWLLTESEGLRKIWKR